MQCKENEIQRPGLGLRVYKCSVLNFPGKARGSISIRSQSVFSTMLATVLIAVGFPIIGHHQPSTFMPDSRTCMANPCSLFAVILFRDRGGLHIYSQYFNNCS